MSDFAVSMMIITGFWLSVITILGIISLIIAEIRDRHKSDGNEEDGNDRAGKT